MIRPDRLVVAAMVLTVAGCTALFGAVGFGVAALIEAMAAAAWAVLLVRGDDGRT